MNSNKFTDFDLKKVKKFICENTKPKKPGNWEFEISTFQVL